MTCSARRLLFVKERSRGRLTGRGGILHRIVGCTGAVRGTGRRAAARRIRRRCGCVGGRESRGILSSSVLACSALARRGIRRQSRLVRAVIGGLACGFKVRCNLNRLNRTACAVREPRERTAAEQGRARQQYHDIQNEPHRRMRRQRRIRIRRGRKDMTNLTQEENLPFAASGQSKGTATMHFDCPSLQRGRGFFSTKPTHEASPSASRARGTGVPSPPSRLHECAKECPLARLRAIAEAECQPLTNQTKICRLHRFLTKPCTRYCRHQR